MQNFAHGSTTPHKWSPASPSTVDKIFRTAVMKDEVFDATAGDTDMKPDGVDQGVVEQPWSEKKVSKQPSIGTGDRPVTMRRQGPNSRLEERMLRNY